MSDKIVFRKGLLENLEDLPIAAPGFITNPGEERLVIGGANGNVLLPNAKDINEINSSLNALANNKANKNNAEFTGTLKLNNKNILTEEKYTKTYTNSELLNGWQNVTDEDWARLAIYRSGPMCYMRVYDIKGGGINDPVCVLPDFCRSAWVDDYANTGIRITDRNVYINPNKQCKLVFAWIN